jgi:hypothetical protein
VSVHPRTTFITGGGLQDTGTYLGYGGDSWYRVGGGDGGPLSFDFGDPRRYYTSTAGSPEGGWMWRADVAGAGRGRGLHEPRSGCLAYRGHGVSSSPLDQEEGSR